MSIDSIPVRVMAIEQVAPMIREFKLEAIEGRLPAFSPGSHVQVIMPGASREIRNAYSLCGDPATPRRYSIAVRLQDASRGGSSFMHGQVNVGDQLAITPHGQPLCSRDDCPQTPADCRWRWHHPLHVVYPGTQTEGC